MKQNELFPKIRFKEFTNTWEQWKIKELFKVYRGLGITKKDMSQFKYGDFKYPVYSSQTTNDGLIGYYNRYMFNNAITWTTDGAKAGTVFYRNDKFFATSHCGILTKKLFDANEYFSIIISKNTQRGVTWVAMPMLTTNEMGKISIICSLDKEEQYKISSLINNFDSLITFHQCKLNLLKNAKNRLLEKMFCDEKSQFPTIRFKEFTNTWEQEKLEDVTKVITGGEPPSDFIRTKMPIKDYKYPIYSNGLGENSLWGFSKTYTINVPAITISSIGTVGFPKVRNPFFTPIIRLKTIISNNEKIDIDFLKNVLDTIEFDSTVAGIPSINSEIIKKIQINITKNTKEQKLIATLFSNLNSLITLHQRKLELLKNVKNTLLEKMFV